MTVTIEKELTEDLAENLPDIDYQKTAEDILDCFLDTVDCPYEADVSILLTGEDSIREINREQRGIDKVTDVLSFPMHEYASPAHFEELNEESFDDFSPETGELLLGDIVLCIPKITEQAKTYGHTYLREYAFLVVHSLLHLVGYDHMREEDEETMKAMQRLIMEKLGISREGSKEE